MKKLIVSLLILFSSVAYSQGVGYLNYTVYNIVNNQVGAYANNATNFVTMFDVTKGSSIYATGTSTAAKTLYFVNGWQPSGVPNGGAYTGIKITGWFVPKETGIYSFGIDGDDGVDFSLDGNVVTSFYGPHGFGGYRYGSVNLVAGKVYTFMARYQNWGGGWGLDLAWKRPSQSNWSIQPNEIYSTQPAVVPSINVQFNLNFNSTITPTLFNANIYNLANNTFTTTPNNTPTAISTSDTVVMNSSIDTVKVNNKYKTQYLQLTTSTDLNTLYNNVVTVSDVYLAFQEYANQGLLGNQMGTSFISAIQYINADVNFDGKFNEADCYLLLQHLTGKQSLVTSLPNLVKLYPKAEYDTITHTNWSSHAGTRNFLEFTPDSADNKNVYNVSVSWLGDVNMSHSTSQTAGIASFSLKPFSTVSNQIYSSIVTQLVGDSVYATITLNPLQQQVVGTQYHLNYDNTVLKFQRVDFKTAGTPSNFGNDKGNYINFGSLITNGMGLLSNTTVYKVVFTPITPITNTLGLMAITPIDAVNQSGTQLQIKIN
jgi:hypothetical protein